LKIQIAGFLDNSTVNGEGMRSVVFFSGCTLNCPSCHNKEMQTIQYGDSVDSSELMKRIEKNKPIIDGVTISGGDPFLQIDELIYLLGLIKESNFNVCVYTGQVYENLLEDNLARKALDLIDVLIDGPYIETLPTDELYIGSSNQRIIDL